MILLAHNQTIPKIICDHTLEESAQWLRAAGYDVHIPFNNLDDIQLLDLATRDERVLLISKRRARTIPTRSKNVAVIDSDLVFEQIKQISSLIKIDWLYKPFSRCMICNSDLVKLNLNQWMELPDNIQSKCVTSHGCPSCSRIYWAGDQINRMVNQLQIFNTSGWYQNRKLSVDS